MRWGCCSVLPPWWALVFCCGHNLLPPPFPYPPFLALAILQLQLTYPQCLLRRLRLLQPLLLPHLQVAEQLLPLRLNRCLCTRKPASN